MGTVAPGRSRRGGAKTAHQNDFMTNEHKVSVMEFDV